MKKSNELLSTPLTPQELHDQRTRTNNAVDQLLGNQVYTRIDNIQDQEPTALSDNPYQLGIGEQSGIIVEASGAEYIGVPGTIINPTIEDNTGDTTGRTVAVRINPSITTVRFSNMTFNGRVHVSEAGQPGGTTLFTNCVFNQIVKGSGVCIFIGCVFKGTPTSTDTGLPSYVIGCNRLNGGAYAVGTIVIAEIVG